MRAWRLAFIATIGATLGVWGLGCGTNGDSTFDDQGDGGSSSDATADGTTNVDATFDFDGSGSDGSNPFCTPRTCAQAGATCGPIGDGCGGILQCGTCTAPETCGGGGTPSQCGGASACVPKTCKDLGIGCGPAGDGCGNVLDCGQCTAPQTCGGGGTPSQCGGAAACVPKTCAQLNVSCGQAGDGCGGILDCGQCTAPATCGGGGTPFQCGGTGSGGADGGNACVPKTCAQLGIGCGPAGDGCGNLINCGGCTAPQSCGGGGTPSQCGAPACTPKTCAQVGATCGPVADGCGGLLSCGSCTAPQTCGGGGVANKCGAPTCTPKTCAQLGANCGPVGDGCGGLITSCGTCTSPQICGGSGTPSVCGSSSAPDGGTTCQNLQCQQVACDGGTTTTLTGKVYDPAGINPLYNALVYVPNQPIKPFPAGVSCDQCGALASGSPLVSTTTDYTGSFTLKNVPAGSSIPLVIQLGKWRRQVTVSVPACTTTPLAATVTRLPRNKSEGDIPLIAISSGSADPMECLLLKIGIDPAEFTSYTGNGRVNFYHENGTNTNPAAPTGSTLWSTLDSLKKYDMVLLPCEGSPNDHGDAARSNLLQYSALGGKLFTTHYSYAWDQPIWPTVGAWDLNQTFPPSPITATLNTSFPKGKSFADWLKYIFPTTTYGQLQVIDSRHDIDKVNNPPALEWANISGLTTGNGTNNARGTQHMTWNTPIDAGVSDAGASLACGKVLYSDFHVSTSATNKSQGGKNKTPYFPQICVAGPMTPQEAALEFMFFDLSSCVQNDTLPPPPPPTCTPRTCAQANANCGPVADGCGGIIQCGTCVSPQTCGGGGTPSKCGGSCTPKTCAQLGVGCGPAGDGCGGTLDCGTCVSPQTCGGGGVPSQCGGSCTPKTCAQLGVSCGPAGDGCGGTLQCGTCGTGTTCGGGGVPGKCGATDSGTCKPLTCAAQNIGCGPAGDGCGGLLQCGTCVAPQTCGGGGVPGQCGAPSCTPTTCAKAGVTCGPIADGCGGLLQCGACVAPQTCGGGGVPGQCGAPSCTPKTCGDYGVGTCGVVADGCGGTIDCGACVAPQTCGGGGTANKCGGGIN